MNEHAQNGNAGGGRKRTLKYGAPDLPINDFLSPTQRAALEGDRRAWPGVFVYLDTLDGKLETLLIRTALDSQTARYRRQTSRWLFFTSIALLIGGAFGIIGVFVR